MNSPAIKFIGYTILLTLACIALQLLVYHQMGESIQLKSGFLLLSIFVVGTVGIHLILLSSTKGSPQGFVRSFMGATMGKFLFYLSVLVVFLAFSTENKKMLVLHFLFYYAVFTVFEVSMLYSTMRKLK